MSLFELNMKPLCCVLVLVVLLCGDVVSSITSKDKENVEAGIKTINTINGFIQSRNFNTFVSTLTQNTKSIMNAASSLVKLKKSGIDLIDSNGYSTLPARIYSSEYEEVKRLIDWSVVQITYGSYEATIHACARMLREILDAPSGAIDAHIKDYIMKYESDYRNSGLKVWEGMVYERSFTNNIIAAARKYTYEHRRMVQNFVSGVSQLLAEAVEVEVAYAQMKHNNDIHTDTIKDRWTQRIQALSNKLETEDVEIKAQFPAQHSKDYERLARENPGANHEHFKNILFNYFKGKYYWRRFVVYIVPSEAKYLAVHYCDGGSHKRGTSYVIYGSTDLSIKTCTPGTLKAYNPALGGKQADLAGLDSKLAGQRQYWVNIYKKIVVLNYVTCIKCGHPYRYAYASNTKNNVASHYGYPNYHHQGITCG